MSNLIILNIKVVSIELTEDRGIKLYIKVKGYLCIKIAFTQIHFRDIPLEKKVTTISLDKDGETIITCRRM